MVKLAELWPAGMVMEAGGKMLGLLEKSETTIPPVGAGALNVTVPVKVRVPSTSVGVHVNEVRWRLSKQ
jgi:hypothetical protein